MGMVTSNISVSLDGFVAGPNDGVDNPMGDGGERLHEWVFGLASWREPHGRLGGETNRDDGIFEEPETTRVVESPGSRISSSGW
jgi:hypothetical protein